MIIKLFTETGVLFSTGSTQLPSKETAIPPSKKKQHLNVCNKRNLQKRSLKAVLKKQVSIIVFFEHSIYNNT